MKKLFFSALALMLVFNFSVKAQDLSLDEVLANHFEAVGQDKLLKVNSIFAKGKQIVQGGAMEFPFRMLQARPNKLRIEAEVQGATMVQAFDGTNGWMVAPWTGSTDPQDMSPEQVKGLKEQADMDGNLYNWKTKGHSLEMLESEEFEGTEAYVLKLTKKVEKEGDEPDIYTIFMDQENFVILGIKVKTMVQGNEIEATTVMSNYEMHEGMAMAHSISTKMNGQTMSEIVIESVEFNVEVTDEKFAKPESK